MIGCPEEIAYRKGYINRGHLRVLGDQLKHDSYGDYRLGLAGEESKSN